MEPEQGDQPQQLQVNDVNIHNKNQSLAATDTGPCPICLGSFVEESYLDICFHKFCYTCILHWTKVVAAKHSRKPPSVKCPLCKVENFSIIYGYDGSSFQRQHVNQDFATSSFFSKAHRYRLQCYYTEPGLLDDKINVSQYWKSRKYLQLNRWLQSWLKREIQALTQEEDVDIITHHILGVIDSFSRRNEQVHQTKKHEAKQEEFKTLVSDAARPFLARRTDRFVNELIIFLASGLNIEAYDEVYKQHLGWNTSSVIVEDEDSESNELVPAVPYLYIFDENSSEGD
ncbi:hypothetical protein K2173_027193 [Erythroxylum novogranatense]|uniref:RING-type domain-containing protein n=1 Tax=Erythroxylum novogranatense TaxID=1862640 RepID=A0AAV8TYD2_9ROSI|nr:hypothetical protein K2173_027193 [Erythroxylum novogranatense]